MMVKSIVSLFIFLSMYHQYADAQDVGVIAAASVDIASVDAASVDAAAVSFVVLKLRSQTKFIKCTVATGYCVGSGDGTTATRFFKRPANGVPGYSQFVVKETLNTKTEYCLAVTDITKTTFLTKLDICKKPQYFSTYYQSFNNRLASPAFLNGGVIPVFNQIAKNILATRIANCSPTKPNCDWVLA